MFASRTVTQLKDVVANTTQNLCNVFDRYTDTKKMNMRH